MILPTPATDLVFALAPVFTQPTYHRFLTLLVAALLTPGRRTIANLLRTLGPLATGHRTSFQRVLSAAHWSSFQLACLFTRFRVRQLLPTATITLVGDDTVDGHKGKHVHGKARHRDPVRSSHTYTAWRYGHKWVVLAVLVRFSWASRPWALPILVDLCRSAEDNRQRRRPHRTPAQLLCRLLRVLLGWFPERQFRFVGDAGYGTHEVARFGQRYRPRLTLVSKFHPKANLYEAPPPYQGQGRPRVQGAARPKPQAAVTDSVRQGATVSWYGGGTRQVEVVRGSGHWYKAGCGLVAVRWVFVHDRDGTHRDEYFFTTDLELTAAEIVGYYTGRWNIETTFEELRAYLGLETTRGWCAQTVLRAAPLLFGLYSVVAWLYQALPAEQRTGGVQWPGKVGVTFSDALSAVRRWLWTAGVFPQVGDATGLKKLPAPLQEIILAVLAPAA